MEDLESMNMNELSVVIIDDSTLSQKVAVNILKEAGFNNITVFTDPVTFLKEYKEFDLFIVDIVMPSISGEKLVDMIRKMSPGSIILGMSTIDNIDTISRVLSTGADDYVIKPVHKLDLLARIRTNYRSFSLLKELEVKNRELDLMAKTDSLTGAFNHGHIFSLVKSEIKRVKKNSSSLSLLLIDLDHFKDINDTFGHGVGDQVLKTLARVFQKWVKDSHFFGRYGGEEFMLLMPNISLSDAYLYVEQIRSHFLELRIKGVDRPVTFSGGLVQWNETEGYKEFIKRADDLLYRAKEGGRNQIIY